MYFQCARYICSKILCTIYFLGSCLSLLPVQSQECLSPNLSLYGSYFEASNLSVLHWLLFIPKLQLLSLKTLFFGSILCTLVGKDYCNCVWHREWACGLKRFWKVVFISHPKFMLCSVPRMLNVSEYILLDVVISSTVEHVFLLESILSWGRLNTTWIIRNKTIQGALLERFYYHNILITYLLFVKYGNPVLKLFS